MRYVPRTAAAALVPVLLALVAGSATAGTAPLAAWSSSATTSAKATIFTASYAGRAVVRATSDTTADINVTGAGKGNAIGVSKVTGIGTGFKGDPCSTFGGKGTMTGKLGKINFTLGAGSKTCPSASDPNQNAITASAKVTGGTLKYKKARGLLRITGNYDRSKGTFTATFKGPLTF